MNPELVKITAFCRRFNWAIVCAAFFMGTLDIVQGWLVFGIITVLIAVFNGAVSILLTPKPGRKDEVSGDGDVCP